VYWEQDGYEIRVLGDVHALAENVDLIAGGRWRKGLRRRFS
jgi:hypothetical protein